LNVAAKANVAEMSAPRLVILILCFASLALADDFKTINGKEYKNVTVSRVEADGIVIKGKSGISKVYFVELPKEVQERFHYNPAQAADFTKAQQAAVAQQNAPPREKEQQQRAEAIKKTPEAVKENVRSILEVESDQPSFLDQPVLLEGTIGLDNFYIYGYNRAQQTHYCFKIKDSSGRCNAYMEREKAANLRQQLISARKPVKGLFTVVLLSRRYKAGSPPVSLFVELLDYRLEQ
jgi:hypothetical protein